MLSKLKRLLKWPEPPAAVEEGGEKDATAAAKPEPTEAGEGKAAEPDDAATSKSSKAEAGSSAAPSTASGGAGAGGGAGTDGKQDGEEEEEEEMEAPFDVGICALDGMTLLLLLSLRARGCASTTGVTLDRSFWFAQGLARQL